MKLLTYWLFQTEMAKINTRFQSRKQTILSGDNVIFKIAYARNACLCFPTIFVIFKLLRKKIGFGTREQKH